MHFNAKPIESIQFETELKIKIDAEDQHEIETRIQKKGMRFKKEVVLEDTYFDTDPPTLPNNRVLKLRIERDQSNNFDAHELTIKEQLPKPSLAILEKIEDPNTNAGIQTRKEISIKVSSKKEIKDFLHALNYIPIIEVKKIRRYFHNANGNLTICLDRGPLGTYMEIEEMNNDTKESGNTIKRLLKELLLGLEYQIENRSYLEIAKDKKYNK